MSQHTQATYPKSVIKISDIRAYSQNKTITPTYSYVQNAEDLSISKIPKDSNKTIQKLTPSSKPQPSEQSFKDKIQQIESRLNQQNKYLRQSTQAALQKLQQANQTIKHIKKQKETTEIQNRKLLNELERKNISAKQLTDVAQKMRKQNALLNKKIADMNLRLNAVQTNSKNVEISPINLRDKVYGVQISHNQFKRQFEDRNKDYQKMQPKEISSNFLYPPQNSFESKQLFSRPTLSSDFMMSQRRSIDRMGHSRQSSLARSKRSNSRSSYIQPQLSPKQSARMEILFEQIAIIKKNISNGGKLTQAVVNKLISLINHLSNTLNKRNNQTLKLKAKLRQYQEIPISSRYQSVDISHIQDFSPLTNNHRDISIKSREKSRNAFETQKFTKQQSMNLISPNRLNPPERQNIHTNPPPTSNSSNIRSTNQSTQVSRAKYNYVYKRIQLQEYLDKKLVIESMLDLIKKIFETIEKQLTNSPRQITIKDFYILYCEGQCPVHMKLRVELKPKSDQNNSCNQPDMMKSIGLLFEQILKSIKIQSFQTQKIFDKQINPKFNSIISNLIVDEPQRANMQKLKDLIQKTNN